MYGVYLCVYQTSAYCSEKLKYVHTNFVCQVFNNEKTKRINSKKLSHLNLEKSGNIPAQIKELIVYSVKESLLHYFPIEEYKALVSGFLDLRNILFFWYEEKIFTDVNPVATIPNLREGKSLY